MVIYGVLRGLQNLCSFWFYLFFPTITPKVLTFNYKLHDNYKPCMKAFNPENTLFEFDERVQVPKGSGLPFVLLFGFQWKFLRNRLVTNLISGSKPFYLQMSYNQTLLWF